MPARDQSSDAPPRVKVLVVGQTPPPFHGQAIMIERLVSSRMDRVELYHVRMAFSETLDEVGRFRISKLWHLVGVIGSMLWLRTSRGTDILYYPPAGPHRIPMARDIVLLICTRWLFRKTLLHIHASGVPTLYCRLGALGRWCFRRAYYYPDAVVRTAEETPDDGRALRALREFIVPNSADDEHERFGSHLTRGTKPPGEPVDLLYVGTVCRSKGILVLLEACHLLKRRGVRFRLRVVGGFQPSAFEAEVHRAIRDRGLEGSVLLCGQLTGDEKWLRFSEADVFCFPTFFEAETFPCVVLEAMSFGLPVVATRWRGLPAMIEHGAAGFLTAVGDAEALGEYLARLSADPELRASMGTTGRAKYLAEYTTSKYIERMEQVLVTVAGNHTR